MNPFHITIKKQNIRLPAGSSIPAAILTQMDASLEIETRANTQAQLILQQAEEERQRLLCDAQQQAIEMMEHARSEMEERLLHHHVNWLVQTEQLGTALVEQARCQIMRALTTVVQCWAGQQSVEEILIARLTDQIEEMAQQGTITLRVHPQRFPALEQALGDRLALRADPTLDSDQAILASPLLSLTLSLSGHLSQLVAWLHESSEILPDGNQ